MGLHQEERITVIQSLEGALVTIDAAAEATGLSYWQTRRLIRARGIRARRVGHQIFVRLADVQNALRD